MNCQRCGSKGVSWTNDQITLLGGVVAHLCADCITEFDGMLAEREEWQAVLKLDARKFHHTHVALAKRPVSEEEVLRYLQDRHDIERKIRAIALEFVKPIKVESVA